MTAETPKGVVLVADDDEMLRMLMARAVTSEGFTARTVADGDEAVRAFAVEPIDLVLSDIDMPGRTGIGLLKAIREKDLDVPVILITGAPRLETAIAAVDFGATRYLTKPIDVFKLRETIRWAMGARRLATARRALLELADDGGRQVGDLAGLTSRFDHAMATLYMAWQPLIRWSTRSTFAYEALVRSGEPTLLPPGAFLDAAERLGRTADIGRGVRALCGAADIKGSDSLLFVNLHTQDLIDDELFKPDAPLARIAHRVVLEITERARLEVIPNVPGQIAKLRNLGYRIAIDDIGAGYAGLTSFAALEPNFMKLDRALIQQIHESRTKTRLVGAMVHACNDLGVQVVAEGIETTMERDALVDLGCDVMQGFLFAKPSPEFVTPKL